MQLRQIEVFHAFMITGSTVGAAEHLHVTQPAVSTTLKRMQDELGLALFRTVRGRLVPTPEAHVMFRQVRALHEDVDQLRRLARRLANGSAGLVRFGVVPAMSEGPAARAIAAIRRDAPDVQVTLDVLNTHELLHRVQSGRLDLACVFAAHEHMPLTVHHRMDVEIVAVAPEGWVTGSSVTLGALAALPLALMRPTDPIGYALAEACAAQDVRLASSIELRSSRMAIAMARQGVAVGLADRATIAEGQPEGVRAVSLDPPLTIPAAIVSASERSQTELERRLCGELSAEMMRLLGRQL